jgi:endonuclease G
MKFYIVSIIPLAFIFFVSCKKELIIPENEQLAANVSDHQVVEHFAYTLSYNEEHEQADWVAYELSYEEVLNTSIERTDDFRPDATVLSGSAELNDYEPTNSIYARGHLAPAADFRWNQTAMSESFYMSNISPMLHAFNEGKWFYLEAELRHWAEIYDGIYIVTGPVLKADLEKIGTNEVSIPEMFFKVILDLDEEKGIGFLMPHEDINDSFKNYAVSIDRVEEETGLDFFPSLNNKDEEKIESNLNLSKWSFEYYK